MKGRSVIAFGFFLAVAALSRAETAFVVTVDGHAVSVESVRVAPADEKERMLAMDDPEPNGKHFDLASYASFPLTGKAHVVITCPDDVRSVKVLPTSYAITPTTAGRTISFDLGRPRQLTVEVNGEWCRSLHLFADPPEKDVPDAKDPSVKFFAAGVHEIADTLRITDGQTLYLAPGAILRSKGGKGPVVSLEGHHVTLRGRGVLDGTLDPRHTRSLLFVHGQDIDVEGITLVGSSTWNMPVRRSDRVRISNVKIFGHRANSDGIDVCNSRDVTVDHCFLRTLDDLVVVKSDRGQGDVRRVVVRDCVLWNQVAHALSVGAELREPVDDVLFTDCDVIHDVGREWTLRVFHSDAAPVTNVRFEDIRVEETRRLFSVWVGKVVWSRDAERGHVANTLFKDVVVTRAPPNANIEIRGFDDQHLVENTTFDHVMIDGRPMTPADISTDVHSTGTKVTP